MSHIYLFFFANNLFLFSYYIYSIGVSKFEFLFIQTSKLFSNDIFKVDNKLSVINDCKSFTFFKKNRKRLDYEKRLKLKKYYQQLNRYLKTLDYLSYVEINSGFKNNIEQQLAEILNLKAKVQQDIIDITSKINQYKLKHKIIANT
ncbi:hypothetical protein SAMN05428642_10445 [Flaviramulus basaltis]|uniref:Transmembrane protein n=1 Tax=Flaviramulus basaltis TaxID=369401 RepID=A0A1K2IPB7_9FLAO|nr:hypothetical protein [Flaviramulus basaltis]SFZ94284.1 hypothetical protein SAMN05428642_10445 [Flaviramulus basaltis]